MNANASKIGIRDKKTFHIYKNEGFKGVERFHRQTNEEVIFGEISGLRFRRDFFGHVDKWHVPVDSPQNVLERCLHFLKKGAVINIDHGYECDAKWGHNYEHNIGIEKFPVLEKFVKEYFGSDDEDLGPLFISLERLPAIGFELTNPKAKLGEFARIVRKK